MYRKTPDGSREQEQSADRNRTPPSNKNRVNSLLKGLRVIETLNAHQSLNANDVAKLTGASRGTTYRLLETLREAGYVGRDRDSGTYWLEPAVLGLSDGMTLESWVWQIAVPIMNDLGGKVTWPLSLVTPQGVTMVVRATTDFQNPTTLHYMSTGSRMPILTTAGGLAYLAFCKASERSLLIELARKSFQNATDSTYVSQKLLLNELDRVREMGYAIQDRGQGITALAVPIFSRSRVFAVLALRYFSSALNFKEGTQRYLKPLQDAASDIGKGFDDISLVS